MKAPYTPPTVVTRSRCLIDGCDRWEELANGRSAGGLCAGHRKRKSQGRPLEPPLHAGMGRRESPRRALVHAAIDLRDIDTDADSDIEWRRALDRLIHAALRYADARREADRRKA